ncbi:MAG: hypothetical protein RLZZ360_152 [Candidatus Parcubacteria bacterium]|jgi:heat shock protein HslJ/membrane-bound inhibitor of C-type lysozyme
MRTTHIVGIVITLALIGGLGWVVSLRLPSHTTTTTGNEDERFRDATVVTYQSNDGEITVAYISNLARISGGKYDGLVLRQIVAASGAKYEGERGVTLWTKNNEVRIETPQQVVYTGTAVPPETLLPTPTVVSEPVLATTTAITTDATTITFRDKTWVWQSAVQDGTSIEPKKSDAFTLTFTTEGVVEGTTDCNGFGGDYTVTDNEIRLGALRLTLMFCENSEESLFIELLESPLTIVTMTESVLELENSLGETVRFLNKEQ